MNRGILDRPQRILVAICSTLFAIALHIAPVWFILFGPVFELPDVFEVDLVGMPIFRDHVFRQMQTKTVRPVFEVTPVEAAVTISAQPEVRTKAATPRKEDELVRARAVQRAIRNLWDSMAPTQVGGALVSLNILPDGSIGQYVINRVQGNKDFQQFLTTFLAALRTSAVNQGGGKEAIWIECEFVVRSNRNIKVGQ